MPMDRIPPEEIDARVSRCHAEIQALVAYWRGKAAGRSMPARKDIDPAELTPFLSRLGIVEVVPDARRFIYRLVGTEDAALRGHDPTGKSVMEGFFGPDAEFSVAHYEYAARYREPYCFTGPFQASDGVAENEDIVFLPLSEDGKTVNMILFLYHSYKFNPRVEHSSVLLRYTQSKRDDREPDRLPEPPR
jgi:hypothetical protein